MSHWTYINGTVTVSSMGRTTEESCVLQHIQRLARSWLFIEHFTEHMRYMHGLTTCLPVR